MKSIAKTFAGAIALTAAAIGIAAAAYPEKTTNDIIAFGPGGESDVSARLQEPFFKKYTGQSVANQYKAGAGGAAAWSQINSVPGDGYTIIGTNLPHIILQPLPRRARERVLHAPDLDRDHRLHPGGAHVSGVHRAPPRQGADE